MKIIPGIDSDKTKLDFSWEPVKLVNENGENFSELTLQLTFKESEYISTTSVISRENLNVVFNDDIFLGEDTKIH